ncbi:ubiquitin P37aP38A, partial [Glomus cerebriforme]
VHVRTLTGKKISCYVRLDDTVSQVKSKLRELEGIPPDQQCIVFSGKQLDDKTLRRYGVQIGSTLHLILNLRGG